MKDWASCMVFSMSLYYMSGIKLSILFAWAYFQINDLWCSIIKFCILIIEKNTTLAVRETQFLKMISKSLLHILFFSNLLSLYSIQLLDFYLSIGYLLWPQRSKGGATLKSRLIKLKPDSSCWPPIHILWFLMVSTLTSTFFIMGSQIK